MPRLPKYTKAKMKGNIGEAIAQYIFSGFCLVHRIDGASDIGNDFICELIRDQYPTNLLFYVQVKYTNKRPTIKKETLEYWKGSPIPVYLFWIKDKKPREPFGSRALERAEKRYKRYTPILHRPDKHSKERFKPYNELGFKRDLIVDYARTQYAKGFTPIVEPRSFLEIREKIQTRLPKYALFIKDVIPEYSGQILSKSWVSLFVTAVLLYKEGGYKNLRNSKKALDLARKLYLSSPDSEDKTGYTHFFEAYRSPIERKLSELKSAAFDARDFFLKTDVENSIRKIEKLLGAAESWLTGPYREAVFTEIIIKLNDLLQKLNIFGHRVSFRDDVDKKIGDVTDLVRNVRNAACHVESEEHFLEDTSIKFTFNIAVGKGGVIKYTDKSGKEKTLSSDYDDDICFFFGENKIYLERHIVRALNEAATKFKGLYKNQTVGDSKR